MDLGMFSLSDSEKDIILSALSLARKKNTKKSSVMSWLETGAARQVT